MTSSLQLVARNLRLDSKKRLTLSKISVSADTHFDVYCNERGQIILDPQIAIPAAEAWLFQDKAILGTVRKGLQEAAEQKLLPSKSFARYAKE